LKESRKRRHSDISKYPSILTKVYRFAIASALNAKVSNSCNNYAVVRKYIKDPRLLFEAKKSPYYLIDSTYTVASDPNTMRDTGATRNALYYIRDDVDSYLDNKSTVSGAASSTMSRASKSTVQLKNAINRKSLSNIKAKQIINEMDHMRDTMNSRCSHQKPISSMHHTVGSNN
jgi:hypothetical protein